MSDEWVGEAVGFTEFLRLARNPNVIERVQLMTLWHLILGICFTLPVASSIAAERILAKGWVSYAIALLIGFGIGAIGARAMWVAFFGVVRRRHEARPFREWQLGTFYAGSVVWACFLGIVSYWLTRAVA